MKMNPKKNLLAPRNWTRLTKDRRRYNKILSAVA